MSDYVARYREQSIVTSVHPYEVEIEGLPQSIRELVEIVDGLIVHFKTDEAALDKQTLVERRHEVDSRLVSTMLQRIFSLNEAALSQRRPADQRLLGTCRDTAVLLCSFMRHQGIPARVRFGFAHMLYQRKNPLHNHAVVEYWNGSEWLLAESRMPYVRGSDTPFAPDDLPRSLFMPAGEAWRQLRAGEQTPQAFSGHQLGERPSRWLVLSFVMYDLASLAGYETLMWDQWGRYYEFSDPRCTADGSAFLDLLDRAAATDCRLDLECRQLIDLFRDVTDISNGTEIHSFSPVLGRYSITV
ncbi:transglutaminase-like domain-containing protein [Trinickia caryophylli]|uniref:Transglutaminase-like superfamily protein n=1 Tax=Trinickia caryophylli TaxID=28094 RepID=A0A1X7G578_TRICW|nr:transglutaminase-like domain-containing protein [Trinickia caryophylli]PMS13800.1 transglutaminase domain-containing protein [Trinickia caryophylli]TRX14301.1 transglutaminase domain-containing protein [Trinickia caryophylli]WQE14130.1 transglutaminase-like domain-containing protein [Trinickia caryophylli]SMF64173.1 Transglutaminase-like superfamily protein [Trinickia caryophylli]GLU33371.1 hypothetical protein Busp01_32130 [Trinickia caryophylli]